MPLGANRTSAFHRAPTACSWAGDDLPRELLDTRELDGRAYGYSADEWLPVVYEVAAPLLGSARLDQEPPAVVKHTDAVVKLDQDSPETPAALADALSRLLIVCVFGATARELGGGPRVA